MRALHDAERACAELDLDQIWALVDDLLEAHGTWLPEWARPEPRRQAS